MKKFLSALLAASLISGTAFAMKSVTIQDQGSFMAGGKIITENEKTLHGDHAYVFYQIPAKAKKYSLVFLHGYGQSGKSWETTPDGRDGFQNIFLSKGYKVYIVDQPRRGRAGQSTEPYEFKANPDDQIWYYNFRIGEYPEVYDGVKFPSDKKSIEQFLHQIVPSFPTEQKIISDAMVEVMNKSGDGILVTHSAGGGPGWETAIRSEKVKAVISLEPGTFPFPAGEVPEVEKTSSPFPAKGQEVSMEDFLKLTKIPIAVYFGDNVSGGEKISENWGFDNWRVRLNLAKKWEQIMKKYGGDVEIICLPDIGIKGNTHFMMSDLNNLEVADAMEKWIKSKNLGG